MKTPGKREVDKALKQLRRAVTTAQKLTNQSAAKLVAKGKYGGAETLVARAKAVEAFEKSVKSLIDEWRHLLSRTTGAGIPQGEATVLWEYYQPVLQAVVALGGEAKLPAIEDRLASASWKPGDLQPGPHGQVRWKGMVKKTRSFLVKEGWLEIGPGNLWCITDAGRRAAASQAKPAKVAG